MPQKKDADFPDRSSQITAKAKEHAKRRKTLGSFTTVIDFVPFVLLLLCCVLVFASIRMKWGTIAAVKLFVAIVAVTILLSMTRGFIERLTKKKRRDLIESEYRQDLTSVQINTRKRTERIYGSKVSGQNIISFLTVCAFLSVLGVTLCAMSIRMQSKPMLLVCAVGSTLALAIYVIVSLVRILPGRLSIRR